MKNKHENLQSMWKKSFRTMRYVFRRLSMQFLGILFHCIELFHYFVTKNDEFKEKIINGEKTGGNSNTNLT